MGFFIVTIVGLALGWLIAIAVDRDDRVTTLTCAVAGMLGALIAAVLAGEVPLAVGVSATQLLWGVLGATFAIICVNVVAMRRVNISPRKI